MKTKYTFVADIDSDIWNWQDATKVKISYGRDFHERIPSDITLKQVEDEKYLKSYLQKKYYRKKAVNKYTEYLQAAFDGSSISDDLKSLMGYGLPYEEVLIRTTTFQRCPYNPDKGTLFVSYGSPHWVVKRVTYHECMHMLVHKYYWHLFTEAGLSNEQAHDIKEALTVLLNPTLVKKGLSEDMGYQIHQVLRAGINKFADKGHTFDEILIETIKLYQKNPITK